MIRSSFAPALLSSAILLLVSSDVTVAQTPNIVLIMADDMGFADTSNPLTTLGDPSDFYETPVLDRLASEGMAFTNAYSSGVNCAPTRAAFLTGQWAQRPTNNVYNVANLNRGGNSTLLVGPSQGLPSGTDAIPNNAFTYAEMLQQTGYTTAHAGKFHVVEVNADSEIINSHGFDYNYGGETAGNPNQYLAIASGANRTFGGGVGPGLDPFAADYTTQYVQDNIIPYANGTSVTAMNNLVGTRKHLSDAMADAAIDFMELEKGGRFMLQYNPYAVHTPIEGRADLIDKYQNKPPGTEVNNVGFAALLEGMDQNIGRLINYLETTPDPQNPGQNLDENTIVFFVSDNGGIVGLSNVSVLEGEKGELDEGGIRVPMVAWSGNSSLVDGGTVNHTPVASIDFYKTFGTLTGSTLPTGIPLDGEDLAPIISDVNATLSRDNLFWHFPGYLINGGRDQRPQTVVRSGDWKLLYNYEDQSFELYNLATDLSESTNLADSNPVKVDELGQLMLDWLNDTDAPLATLRTGSVPLQFDGQYYANETISSNNGVLTILAGQELPFILGDFINPADLNLDDVVDVADWLLFRSGQGADLSQLTPTAARMLGDLDGDLDNDFFDFQLFKNAYIQSTSALAFAQLSSVAVPEPSTLTALSVALLFSIRLPRSRAK